MIPTLFAWLSEHIAWRQRAPNQWADKSLTRPLRRVTSRRAHPTPSLSGSCNEVVTRSSQFAVRSSQFAVRSSQFAVRSSQRSFANRPPIISASAKWISRLYPGDAFMVR